MLDRSFIHLTGVTRQIENSLWSQGCEDWSTFLSDPERFDIGDLDRKKLVAAIKRSTKARQAGEHQFFRKKLGLKEAWRAFPDFKGSCVYLDIETDGRTGGSSITTVGLYDGIQFCALLRGVDLGNFPDIISNYSMIVTFHGSGFDLPILQKRFPLTKLDQIHLDLCPTLRFLGHRGGLKAIERELGIARSDQTAGLTGYDAVRLWRRYSQLGDERALDLLIAYNREDVVNMQTLAEYTYRSLWETTYLASPVNDAPRFTQTVG